MMYYKAVGTITNTTNAEMLTAVTYLRDHYKSKTSGVSATGDTKVIAFSINATDYDDMLAIRADLDTQFADRLHWILSFRDA